MLNYMSAFGRDAEFTVDYGGGISKNKIRLTVPGNPVDPFSLTENASDEEQGLANILLRIGQRPKWKYARGVNTIIYTLEKRSIPDWGKLLAAIIAAVVLGLAVRMLPENISTVLQKDIIEPLLQTFLGFLNAVAGPMIFLSVVWGIYSIGDASTFSEVGRRICVRYLLYLLIMTVLVALISLPFFSLQIGNAQNGSQYSELYQMVLNIIPNNRFTPFSRSNTLQIMTICASNCLPNMASNGEGTGKTGRTTNILRFPPL